jgi:phosphoglycolate phosphatase
MAEKGILFDMDGTLWDASEQVTAAWNIALVGSPETADVHVTTPQIQSVMGKTMTEIFNRLLPHVSEAGREKFAAECCRTENEYLLQHGAKLYPHEAEILEALSRDYRLFIVSNCQDGYIEAYLGYYGFGRFFTDTECFGRTGKKKAENISLLLGRNRLEKAVYVGDTQLDFESASSAGIPFIHAAYGYGKVEEAAPSIRAISELPAVVSKIL